MSSEEDYAEQFYEQDEYEREQIAREEWEKQQANPLTACCEHDSWTLRCTLTTEDDLPF